MHSIELIKILSVLHPNINIISIYIKDNNIDIKISNIIELIKILINLNVDPKINIKSIYIKDDSIDITISNIHELGEKEYNLRIGS